MLALATYLSHMGSEKNLIVLRYKRVSVYDLGGIEAHGRRVADPANTDPERRHLNEYLVGHEHLTELADERIRALQMRNVDVKRAALKRGRRTGKIRELDNAVAACSDDTAALAELIGWPWHHANTRPFTEGVLSASHEWFLDAEGREDEEKVREFLDFAKAYLETEFGQEVIYARADRDEKTTHVQFVVAPSHIEQRTKHYMLSHSSHRLFGQVEVVEVEDDAENEKSWMRKSYEIAQDRIADFAKDWGIPLARGERRAEKERELRAKGQQVIKRKNVAPARARELAEAMVGEAQDISRKADDLFVTASEDRSSAAGELLFARIDKEQAEKNAKEAQIAREKADAAHRDALAETNAMLAERKFYETIPEAIADEKIIVNDGSEGEPKAKIGANWETLEQSEKDALASIWKSASGRSRTTIIRLFRAVQSSWNNIRKREAELDNEVLKRVEERLRKERAAMSKREDDVKAREAATTLREDEARAVEGRARQLIDDTIGLYESARAFLLDKREKERTDAAISKLKRSRPTDRQRVRGE